MEEVSQEHSYQHVGYVAGGTGFDVLTLLGVATDIYSKLSYDDTDCHKKIICEFMEEPDMFGEPIDDNNAEIIPSGLGSGGASVKSGVKYAASWLAPLGFSIVDQITEAATLNDEGKCEQRYRQCEQISLKTTYQEVRADRRDLDLTIFFSYFRNQRL